MHWEMHVTYLICLQIKLSSEIYNIVLKYITLCIFAVSILKRMVCNTLNRARNYFDHFGFSWVFFPVPKIHQSTRDVKYIILG